MLPEDTRPFLEFMLTQHRSASGQGQSSRWSYSCSLLSWSGKVSVWPSSAEPTAP